MKIFNLSAVFQFVPKETVLTVLAVIAVTLMIMLASDILFRDEGIEFLEFDNLSESTKSSIAKNQMSSWIRNSKN